MATSYSVRGKRYFVDAYINNDFHVGKACKAIGVPRRTIYRWMKDDPDFKQQVEDCYELSNEIKIEEAESAHRVLRRGIPKIITKKIDGKEVAMQEGWIERPDRAACEFFLRTIGRHKGYGEQPMVPGVNTETMTKDDIISEIKRIEKIFSKSADPKIKERFDSVD